MTQAYYAGTSPNANDFGNFQYPVQASGSGLGVHIGSLNQDGTQHQHQSDHLGDPHDGPLPHIFEQAESDGGFTDLNDLNLLSDPTMDSMLQNQYHSLGMHSPAQPHSQTGEYGTYNPTAPIAVPNGNEQIYQQQQAGSPHYPSSIGSASGSPIHSSHTSPTPLNMANLSNIPPFLSPPHPHSPNLTPGTPSDLSGSDIWESSSQVSYDGGSSPHEGADLRRSTSAGGGVKNYRRHIEKKSRDKKTTAYMRLKQELETISHKNYGQRCQAEVLDGAAALLAAKSEENRRLQLENQVFRDKLKQYGLWQTD